MLLMNKRVSLQNTCSHYLNNISYNKSNQIRKKPKSFSGFAVRSDFSFAIIYKVSATSIFFLIFVLIDLNFQNCVKRIMGCFALGEHLRANINISKFISSYLRAEVNLEVVTYITYIYFFI